MGKGRTTEDALIDSRISTAQCRLAVEALLKHALAHQAAKEQNDLLPDRTEQYVWLVVAVKRMFPERKLKPFKIPLSHPLVDPRATPICLITKDPQREYKDLLESNNIKFVSRVVGVQKLKGKFKPFEARRMLLKENGLFLADDRVIPLLPKLLGKAFFNAKKQPIPVCLKRKDLKGELERAVSSTYFHQNQGTCSSVKIGVLGQHSSSQLLQNLITALPHVVKNIRENWDNVQSIHIKTSSSASLPIWSCRLDEEEEGRWDGLTRVPIPDDAGEELVNGKKRTVERVEEPAKKKKKSSMVMKRSSSVSQASRPDPSRTELLPPRESKSTRPTPKPSTKPPFAKAKESPKVKGNPTRVVAVDFFDSENPEGCLSPSEPSTSSKTPASRKSAGSSLVPEAPTSKPQEEKPSEPRVLKSSKKDATSSVVDVPVKEKRVKFAAKLSDLKTRRDKALGMGSKKVRSGGGKGMSVKDGVVGKKVAVK